MQNPISFHSIRSLFTPQEVTYTSQPRPMRVVADKPRKFNVLATIMPLEQVGRDVDYSYYEQTPIYLTVARQNANLNTKDVLFGIFQGPFADNKRLVFKDVTNDIVRLLDADEILATRLPELNK